MKKSKNSGITKPCPGCSKVICSAVKIPAVPPIEFRTKCKHCNELIKLCIGQEPYITASKIKVVLIILTAMAAYQVITLTNLHNAFTAMINNNEINTER